MAASVVNQSSGRKNKMSLHLREWWLKLTVRMVLKPKMWSTVLLQDSAGWQIQNLTRNLPSCRHNGYNDIDSWKATLASLHSCASLEPVGLEMKNSLSVLLMMAVVRLLMEGIIGASYVGAEGGGPMCRTGSDDTKLPSKYCLHSSSCNQGKGNKLLLSLDWLGQWNWSVVRNCEVALKCMGGINPLIPASLYGLALMSLWSWPYQISGPSMGLNGTSSNGHGDKSEACFFIFWLQIEQCSRSYDVPLRKAVMRHGPVRG